MICDGVLCIIENVVAGGDEAHEGDGEEEVVWGGDGDGFEKFCNCLCEVVAGDVEVVFESSILCCAV